MPKSQDTPLGGLKWPGQHFHGGRLATATGANEAEDIAATNLAINVVYGYKIGKAHRNIYLFNGGGFRIPVD